MVFHLFRVLVVETWNLELGNGRTQCNSLRRQKSQDKTFVRDTIAVPSKSCLLCFSCSFQYSSVFCVQFTVFSVQCSVLFRVQRSVLEWSTLWYYSFALALASNSFDVQLFVLNKLKLAVVITSINLWEITDSIVHWGPFLLYDFST